ncbi:MAG: acryloyl-CoA reductase [Burkholderiales bacterium]
MNNHPDDATQFRCFMVRDDAGRGVHGAFETLTDARLDAGDVLLRVAYSSVNYKDALAASGRGKIIRRFPCIAGIDAVGVVERSDHPRFSPGDAVIVHNHGFGVTQHGGWAARARAPAAWVNKLPPRMSLLDAITIGTAGYTTALAIDALEANRLAPERGKVLVNGATGGVGSIAIDLLAQRGYHVVAATSKLEQSDYLLALGAKEVIASSSLPTGTRALESALWAGAVDSLGGAPLAALTRTVQKDGVIASIGNAAGFELNTTVMPFILRGVRLLGINSDNDVPERALIWQRLGSDLRPRHLAAIANVQPFDALPQIIETVLAGKGRGRAVISIDPAVAG